jgi:hypothetical protein
MPTRIDKKISQNLDIVNDPSSLQSYLTQRAGRKLNDIKYIGLLRDNALSDVEDPNKALSNIFESITKIADSTEVAQYGTFKPIDFNITRDFIEYQISNSFLSPLSGASVLGGVFGASTSVNPRVRIQDRINLLNSFTGEGTLNNLHSGPLALYYIEPTGDKASRDVFEVKISNYNSGLGRITSGTVYELDYADEFTSDINKKIYINLKSYQVYSDDGMTNLFKEESLDDLGIYAYLVIEGGQKYIYLESPSGQGENSKNLFTSIYNALGASASRTKFVFSRKYSRDYAPYWFTSSPNLAPFPGGPDDSDPETSFALLKYESGSYSLKTEKGFYETGSQIETRIDADSRSAYNGNNVVLDSNIVFEGSPPAINFSNFNWGVRWDGYLRIDSSDISDGVYRFEIETNAQIRIDIASKGKNSGSPEWVNAFDTYRGFNSAIFPTERDRFVSKDGFRLDDLHEDFIYYTNDEKTAGRRYVPISIRVFHGATDISDIDNPAPTLPNLFMKLGSRPGTNLENYYGGDAYIEIFTLSGPIKGNSLALEDSIDEIPIIDIATDSYASYQAFLTERKETQQVVTGIDETTGEPIVESQESFVTLNTPIEVRFSTEIIGGDTYLVLKDTQDPPQDIDAVNGTYRVIVTPLGSYSNRTLWSRYFVSPKRDYSGYADLINIDPNVFTPSVYKNSFDTKPEWWKVSTGNRYNVGETVAKDNDPMDGFVNISMRTSLTPPSPGIGLYGDGSGTYTPRNNLVIGEARYQNSDIPGSNYIGLKFTANKLGEGGKLIAKAIPVDNAALEFPAAIVTSDAKTTLANVPLGADDLGGDPNHKTNAYTSYVNYDEFNVYWNASVAGFILHDLATTPPAQNDTPFLNLPEFDDSLGWSEPLKLVCVGFTDNSVFKPFASPLDLAVYRASIDPSNNAINIAATSISGNQKWIFVFKSTHASAATTLNGKELRAYSENDLAYSYALVDTGAALSFSDTLKLTYRLLISNGGQDYTQGNYENVQLSVVTGTGSSTVDPIVNITVNAEGEVISIESVNSPDIALNTQFELKDPPPAGLAGGTGLQIYYGFLSSLSEIPKGAAERVTPFGYDNKSQYSSLVCYPPYQISDSFLEEIAVDDNTLYNAPRGQYDVFWGDFYADNLGGNILSITEKIEFVFNKNADGTGTAENPGEIISPILSPISLSDLDYTHQIKIEFPLFNPEDPTIPYDEDIYVHIGNKKRINDIYYLYVDAASLPGL